MFNINVPLELPDSQKTVGWNFQDPSLDLNISLLSERDQKVFFEWILAGVLSMDNMCILLKNQYMILDLSLCFSKDSLVSEDVKNYLNNIKTKYKKCKFLLFKKENGTDLNLPIIQLETELNEMSRKELAEQLMREMLSDDLSSHIPTQIKWIQLLNREVLGLQFYEPLLASSVTPENIQQTFLSRLDAISEKIRQTFAEEQDVFRGERSVIGLLRKKIASEDPADQERLKKKYGVDFQWIAFCAARFLRAIKSKKNKIDKHKFSQIFNELDGFRKKGDRIEFSKLFFDVFENDPKTLFLFLSKASRRRYLIAVELAQIFKENFSDKLWDVFSNRLYEEGIYNRIARSALKSLIDCQEISIKNKQALVKHCCDFLKDKKEKTKHHEVWGLIETLIVSETQLDQKPMAEKINAYLNKRQLSGIIDLQEIYREVFKEVLGLTDLQYSQYEKHFAPNTNPKHHVLFGFRQSFSEQPEVLPVVDEFIKLFLREGSLGFRRLRYDETKSSHLKTVFDRESGVKLKKEWENCAFEQNKIRLKQLGEVNISITDDLWDLLTWGEGLNCLDPLTGAYPKHLAHLLNGEHQLALVRDSKGKVLAGYLIHLILVGQESPKPVVAVGKTYIRGDIEDSEIRMEIQSRLDEIVIQKAKTMQIPFVALNLRFDFIKTPLRDNGVIEDAKLMMIQKGFFKGHHGVDKDFVNAQIDTNDEEALTSLLGSYQILFEPKRPQILPSFEQTLVSDLECIPMRSPTKNSLDLRDE